MTEVEVILKRAIDALPSKKSELINSIRELEDDLDDYSDKINNQNIEEDPIYVVKSNKYSKIIKTLDEDLLDISQLIKDYSSIKKINDFIFNFNLGILPLKQFLDNIIRIKNIEKDNSINLIRRVCKESGVRFKCSTKDIDDYNDKVDTAFNIHVFEFRSKAGNYRSGDAVVINMIKTALGNTSPFLQSIIDAMAEAKRVLESKLALYKQKLEDIKEEIRKEKELLVQKAYFNNNKRAYDSKIKEVDSSSVLYKIYMDTHDKGTLIDLCNMLLDLELISQNEYKKILYEKEEKNEEVKEEKVEEVKIAKEELPELDGDYYLRKQTQNIICFLGDDKDNFIKDLNGIDNSSRKNAIKWLVDIFNDLYANKDTSFPLGAPPKPTESNKKTRTLLRQPFGFNYLRFGIKDKDFRIHAITRYSPLLATLGYGSGNITFFGSIDINADDKKDDTYSRVGKRTIDQLSTKKRGITLKPSFDYIEHITRNYIPISLLSENDKKKFNNKEFEGFTIEDNNYVIVAVLDKDTINNIITYLNRYFMKQSTIMFDVITEHKNNKKGSQYD